MEPQLPTPPPSPESGPLRRYESAPSMPAQPEQTPAQTPEQTGERQETRERKVTGDGGGQPQPIQAPAPVVPPHPPASHQTSAVPATPFDNTPMTAGDVDLIEKEWVEKAKKVVAQTKHDPHLQEQAVSRLQADYLQKRYGKEVKLPSEG